MTRRGDFRDYTPLGIGPTPAGGAALERRVAVDIP
jgi:hypothetical protein